MLWSSFLCQAVLWVASLSDSQLLVLPFLALKAKKHRKKSLRVRVLGFWGGSPPAAETDKDWEPESAPSRSFWPGGEELLGSRMSRNSAMTWRWCTRRSGIRSGHLSPFPGRAHLPCSSLPQGSFLRTLFELLCRKRTSSQKSLGNTIFPQCSPLYI